MLELLAGETTLAPEVQLIVTHRLRIMLRYPPLTAQEGTSNLQH
jgi:hypothetical protein